MKTKVHYDATTTLVKGYYPDAISYASIPEPIIEITEDQYKEGLGKKMQVVDGIFREYQPSQTEIDIVNKQRLRSQYADQRDAALAEPFIINIGGIDYLVRHSDLSKINAIVEHLQEQTDTALRRWTDINGNSRHLNATEFNIIRADILSRDEEIMHTYNEQIRILEGREAPQLTVLNTFRLRA